MRRRSLASVAFLLLVALAAAATARPQTTPASADSEESDPNVMIDPAALESLDFRSIGPLRGGRSTAVTGIRQQPGTFLMGSTGGGVWKTTDSGLTWSNISDGFFEVASIGAIAVAATDHNVIYVGTGSACIRGNASTGRGVYRSTDAGKTWQHIGLDDTGTIGRIIVHPRDPERVYVAALGRPFGPNEERGVFRSTDGGDTWDKVLYVSDEVGAVDLSINPANPRHLYAAMWRFERKPWTYYDASEDGGIFKTTDGGDNWNRLAGGLPEGLVGRIGLSVSPADPDRVYAQVQAADPDGGLYRSDDAGATWQKINRDRRLRQRHWYYSHVTADPQDPDTVYLMNTSLYRSIDGGRTLERLRVNHGDTHQLWINPDDPETMILADDGGGEVSTNAGATWSSVLNQPTAELYRVTVDNQFPYRVYAGQQDNSALSLRSDGRGTPQDWFSIGGCESAHVAVDPRNPDVSYAGCYIGEISRFDRAAGERRAISVYPVLVDGVAPRDLEHRFQWNAPIVISRHDPSVLYHASNTVNRSRDEGTTWEVISPDLTRNDPEKQELPGGPLQHDHTSVEVYNTVFVLAESPHAPGELWAGSDDGMIHVTRDDGATWIDVTPDTMPPDGTVNSIDVSVHRPGRVTVAVYRYRLDDWTPYIFRTEDGGTTWRQLADGSNGIPADHSVRVVREDPDREELLYAGTEFGLFVSFDDGAHWQSLQRNLPVTPVTDMVVHRQDLVLSTQGRGFWILDDLSLLHQLTADTIGAESWLYDSRPGIITAGRSSRPVTLRYQLPATPEGEGSDGDEDQAITATLAILDAAGETIRTWSPDGKEQAKLAAEKGINSLVWDLRYPRVELPEGAMSYLGYTGGPVVVPGTYTARLTVDDAEHETTIEVLPDPRRDDVTEADFGAQQALANQVHDLLVRAYDVLTSLRSIRDQTADVAARAEAAGKVEDLRERADAIAASLAQIEDVLFQVKAESNQDPINFPPKLDTQISYLYRYVMSNYGKPNAAGYARLATLTSEVDVLETKLAAIVDTDVAAFNERVRELGLGGVLLKQ